MKTAQMNQIICQYCEESVHRYAVRCPYCNHDLKPAQSKEIQNSLSEIIQSPQQSQQTKNQNQNFSKITQIPRQSLLDEEKIDTEIYEEQKLPDDETNLIKSENDGTFFSSFLKFFVPLTATLAGSFFFFFGLFLKLFSKNGKLVLEWSSESWPYYVFPALLLLIIGFFTYSSVDEDVF